MITAFVLGVSAGAAAMYFLKDKLDSKIALGSTFLASAASSMVDSWDSLKSIVEKILG